MIIFYLFLPTIEFRNGSTMVKNQNDLFFCLKNWGFYCNELNDFACRRKIFTGSTFTYFDEKMHFIIPILCLESWFTKQTKFFWLLDIYTMHKYQVLLHTNTIFTRRAYARLTQNWAEQCNLKIFIWYSQENIDNICLL